MKIGNYTFEKGAALAPMAGVTDAAFRALCRSYGAIYTVSEMVSVKGLTFGDRKSRQLLALGEDELPAAIQLFGDDPDCWKKAIPMALESAPQAAFIDINMGCPAPKIAGSGGGAALMKDLALAGRIIETAVSVSPLPVTVKMRLGWDDSLRNAPQLARIAQEAGAAAICVHGRTREQMYSPPVDIEGIAAVRAEVTIPVIANGDVTDGATALQMLRRTGCDLVMVGRGALGHPWVFAEIAAALKGEPLPAVPAPEERLEIMVEHIRQICRNKGEYVGIREARKHAAWYLKGFPGAAGLRKDCGELASVEDALRLRDKALSLMIAQEKEGSFCESL